PCATVASNARTVAAPRAAVAAPRLAVALLGEVIIFLVLAVTALSNKGLPAHLVCFDWPPKLSFRLEHFRSLRRIMCLATRRARQGI
ncbi:MAG: hypothetical protein WCB68_03490, partial [Pyrinomonadaceae bacterium]